MGESAGSKADMLALLDDARLFVETDEAAFIGITVLPRSQVEAFGEHARIQGGMLVEDTTLTVKRDRLRLLAYTLILQSRSIFTQIEEIDRVLARNPEAAA